MSSYLGIDLGGTIVKLGLVRGGKVVATERVAADSQAGLGRMLGPVGDAADRLLAGVEDLDGVALAFPGIVDFPARRAASTVRPACSASVSIQAVRQWVKSLHVEA